MVVQEQSRFVSAFGPKNRVRLDFNEQTRTHQSGKDECDINKIMAKYVKTGVLDHQSEYGESYGFATSIELLEALTIVQEAQRMFDDLPSSIRTKMDHSPENFLDFVQNPENQAELVELGLAKELEVVVESEPKKAAPAAKKEPPVAEPPPVTAPENS